ncbi:hypothetical protein [Noviherbaspirillum sp. ST9]|uniref:hypothetical protein n=1 Tax=Noviherbaspirillum sp. ST9 TaxID=3401606 RepID=UPI003B58AD5C
MATNGSENSNVSPGIQLEKESERHALLAAEREVAAPMGIGFDGRFYRYRTYRYERFADAINYARLDRGNPAYRAKVIDAAPWEEPVEPTNQERRVMAALGITFDGRDFRYDGFRYEQCSDAANYAQLRIRTLRH